MNLGRLASIVENKFALARFLIQMSPTHYLDVVNAAASGAATLRAATATVAAPVTLTAADLIAGGKTALAACPRQLRFTTAGATPANAPATARVTGWTLAGPVIETVNLAQTAAAVDTVNFFTRIDEIFSPTADGTAATIAIGFTDALGLPVMPRGRGAGGAVYVLRSEYIDGAAAGSAGSLTGPATHKPFGSYTPNAALLPNAARDYLVGFESDPKV